jgi:hypothetical protein
MSVEDMTQQEWDEHREQLDKYLTGVEERHIARLGVAMGFDREWIGLTDDEITELFCNYDGSQFPAFVRTVEANLREKNAYGSQPINDPSEWLD